MEQILTGWLLPILFYSGPLFTYGAVVKIYPTPERFRIFKWCVIVHLFAFVPFIGLIIVGNKDAIHSLILPAVTGSFLFISGLIYLIYISFKTR